MSVKMLKPHVNVHRGARHTIRSRLSGSTWTASCHKCLGKASPGKSEKADWPGPLAGRMRFKGGSDDRLSLELWQEVHFSSEKPSPDFTISTIPAMATILSEAKRWPGKERGAPGAFATPAARPG